MVTWCNIERVVNMTTFGNIEKYRNQNKNINDTIEYLKGYLNINSEKYLNIRNQSVGYVNKIDLSESVFLLEQVYNTKNRNECIYESHLKYIDIHFIIDGYETLEVEDVSRLDIEIPYNEQKDSTIYNNRTKGSILNLKKFDIAIFYPEDGHMTSITLKGNNKVIKIVAKIML